MNLTVNEIIMKKYWPTVIIIEGVPYILTRQRETEVNDVCLLCDLKDICQDGRDAFKLFDICMRGYEDAEWFFAEDWEILDFDIKDFVQHENNPK